jgi:hypothetical protein
MFATTGKKLLLRVLKGKKTEQSEWQLEGLLKKHWAMTSLLDMT